MKSDKSDTEIVQGCLTYLRVSSDEQITNFSLETQENYCKKEAERRNYQILETFREEGVSAKTLNRPQLVKLLSYCQKNKSKISAIIVYRLDRLSRQTSDYLAVRKRLADMGIKIVSCNEPTGEGAVDKFFETVMASLAELDNSIRGERAKAGLRTRFLNGLPTGRPPLGYLNSTKDGKQIIIRDPDSFVKVQKAWEQMATGTKSLRGIADLMTSWGLGLKFHNKTFPVRPQTAGRLFRNKFYFGIVASSVYPDEIKGQHEQMISESLYYKVQQVLDGNKTNLNLKKVKDNEDFSIRGLISCQCGFKLTAAWCKGRNRKYAIYWCPNPNHKIKSISASDLEDLVVEGLRKITPTQRTLELFLTILKRKYYKKLSTLEVKRKAVQNEIKEIKETRKTLALKHAKGVYTDEIYKEIDQTFEDQLLGANIVGNEALIDKYDIEAIINFSRELLSDLGKAYLLGKLAQRRVLIGSIYPSGLLFTEMRTLNQPIRPLFQAIQNPKNVEIHWVGAQGLEP